VIADPGACSVVAVVVVHPSGCGRDAGEPAKMVLHGLADRTRRLLAPLAPPGLPSPAPGSRFLRSRS
jgi:hypothetical protein